MILRPATKFEARVALHADETRGELRRMAGEFYGIVATVTPLGPIKVAVVIFADADHCAQFRAVRAQAALLYASR